VGTRVFHEYGVGLVRRISSTGSGESSTPYGRIHGTVASSPCCGGTMRQFSVFSSAVVSRAYRARVELKRLASLRANPGSTRDVARAYPDTKAIDAENRDCGAPLLRGRSTRFRSIFRVEDRQLHGRIRRGAPALSAEDRLVFRGCFRLGQALECARSGKQVRPSGRRCTAASRIRAERAPTRWGSRSGRTVVRMTW